MGGKSAPAPDYSQLASVSREAVALGKDLGQQQIDFAKQQYGDMLPLAQQVYGLQMDAQRQQMGQAQDYYNYLQNTYRPLEQGLVQQAKDFSSEAYRDQLAKDAALQTARAFESTQSMSDRAAAARGLSLDSPAAMAMRNQGQYNLATAKAGAMNQARTQAEQLGWAKKMDVAGLGRNLAGASTAAYQGATGAGSTGLQSAMAPGSQYGTMFGQGVGTMQQGIGQGISGYGNILGTQANVYNNAMNAEGEFWGSVLGAGATLWKSDARLKENVKQVGSYEQFGLPMYEFEYKGGSGQRYRGVMAQDVEKVVPEAVFEMPDGFKAVNYTMLGIDMIKV